MTWRERVLSRRKQDLWRSPPVVTARGPGWIEHSGRRWVDLSSNDALGLGHQTLSLSAEGGAGSSRLVTGDLSEIRQAERDLANWLGFEEALLMPSGWQANVSLMSALFDKADLVLSDALNHASLVDGLRLSGCRKEILPHADPSSCESQDPAGIVVESLYSVDGDFYPLDRLMKATEEGGALRIVDEAHAVGLYGDRRQGCLADADRRGVIKVVTCSKALGVQGGVILSDAAMRDVIVNLSRGFVYSTGISPLLAAAIRHNIARLQNEDLGHDRLFQTARHLHKELEIRGFSLVSDSGSHIVVIDYPDQASGARARDRLHEAGLWPAWLRWPTVPRGTSRLRLSLTVDLNESHVESLINALEGGRP